MWMFSSAHLILLSCYIRAIGYAELKVRGRKIIIYFFISYESTDMLFYTTNRALADMGKGLNIQYLKHALNFDYILTFHDC